MAKGLKIIAILTNFCIYFALILVYQVIWYISALVEYAPFTSLWFAPAGLSVAILLLWRKDGFIKVWLCVYTSAMVTQHSMMYADNPNLFHILAMPAASAFALTLPYWLAARSIINLYQLEKNGPEAFLIQPVLYASILLAGSMGAMLLGISTQMFFSGMPYEVAESIWIGWWVGDYVGVMVVGPVCFLFAKRYLSRWIDTDKPPLLMHSNQQPVLPSTPTAWIAWMCIILIPSVIAFAKPEINDQTPISLAFLIALLPIAILATRQTWGVLVTASLLSSVLMMITVKLVGIVGDPITYQTTIISISVTSLFLYDFVVGFRLKTQNLLDTERSLSSANKLLAVNEISTNIAHEINTPLQVALSSSQRVRRRLEKLNADWSTEIDELNRTKISIRQVSETIDKIRNLVQTPDLENLQCSVHDSLEKIRSLTSKLLVEHNINIEMAEAPNQALDTVSIAQNEFIQIFLNLITNSIDSLQDFDIKTIFITTGIENSDTIWLDFRDSGPGIGSDLSNTVFDLGYSKKDDGLGLGLWVSKSIAERRGGSLEYINNASQNWCFRLSLKSLERLSFK